MGKAFTERPPRDPLRLPWYVVTLICLIVFFGGGAVWNRWMQGKEAELYPYPGEMIEYSEYEPDADEEPTPPPPEDAGVPAETLESAMHALMRGQKPDGMPAILMLGGWGTVSPVLDYQPLYSTLTDQAKVIVLERPGYGWSGRAFSERTLDNMLGDTMHALSYLGDGGPYVVVAQGTAGLEAIYMADKYPWLVSGIVFINAPPPAVYPYKMDRALDFVKAYSYPVPRVTGIFRAVSVFMPELFASGPEVDIPAYASMFCLNAMSNAMRMEAHMLAKNARDCLPAAAALNVPGVVTFINRADYDANSELSRVWSTFNGMAGAEEYFSELGPNLQHSEIPAIRDAILRLMYNAPPMVIPDWALPGYGQEPEEFEEPDELDEFGEYVDSETMSDSIPVDAPAEEPTEEPTAEPTEEPVEEPTVEPTEEPTVEPTEEPTEEPAEEPSPEPDGDQEEGDQPEQTDTPAINV